jgi:hypothetical protein
VDLPDKAAFSEGIPNTSPKLGVSLEPGGSKPSAVPPGSFLKVADADPLLALQLPFLTISESMGNHDSKIVDADSVD